MPPLIRKIEPGDVIGRCRIIRELGRGGVGTVYLATHQTLQIEVALKVLSPALSLDNPSLAERFIREAQVAARIHHPNVIAVMDAVQDDTTGLYYIVMEYVDGGALSWHLRHGPLPEAKCLSIITGIAHALVLAEEHRIVHRDIKPDNIMLDLRGTSKLADLGLAKQAIDSHTSITLGGSFMGTPAYMSPEQARDAKVADTRDDIYSLGATFYECLTGEPPFKGETPYNIMSELLTKPSPRPRAARPEISRAADLICGKMMAKTRNLRYANARALLHDLQVWQAYGDAGIDRLEAVSFDYDTVNLRREARHLGVDTSADGVAFLPDDDDAEGKPKSGPIPTRQTDQAVFGVAALLIALVFVAVVVLAWMGQHRPFAFLQGEWARFPGAETLKPLTENTPPPPAESTPPVKVHHEPITTTENQPDVPPANPQDNPPAQPVVTPALPSVVPVANDPNSTNVPPVVPAMQVTPDTAFIARSTAENSLDAATISATGTGHAELLKIVGKRDDTQVTPTTWTFYFYDKSAAGHARIVSVGDGKVIKSGEDLVDSLSPYSETEVLPEDKVQKDSSDVLQIATALVPAVTISSSEFVLQQQKNSVPMWKVTLWSKNPDGGERKLGDATILAESGILISNNLRP